MYAEERQSAIVDEVRTRGRVAVNDLAARFAVTGETVRRDLAVLQRDGHLVRVHGGAVRPDITAVVDEPDLTIREETRRAEKAAIGAAAASFLPTDGGSVIIDAGTTTLQLAHAITAARSQTRLTYVTNSLPIATAVADRGRPTVLLTGGRLRPTTGALVGADAVAALNSVRASVGFLGTNALSIAHGLSTPDADEASVKRAMIAACTTIVVLADSSKINREELVCFGGLDDIDVLVTDARIESSFADELRAHHIEVVIA